MESPNSRLSQQQLQAAMQKAIEFRQHVTATVHENGKVQGHGNFFPELFRIAGQLIEKDAQDFCDRAEQVFEVWFNPGSAKVTL